MNQHSRQLLSELCDDLRIRLNDAKEELPSLIVEQETAQAAAHRVEADYRDIQGTVKRGIRGNVVGPLTALITDQHQKLTDARSKVARATGAAQAARSGIAELDRSIAQITGLLLHDATDEETA